MLRRPVIIPTAMAVGLMIVVSIGFAEPIDTITGITIDAIYRQPLTFQLGMGSGQRPTWVNLLGDDDRLLASRFVNANGRFKFSTKTNGQQFPAGTYRLQAHSSGYNLLTTEPFDVAAGQYLDVGVLALVPPAVTFEDIQVCDLIPDEGGECLFSVTLANNRYKSILVEPWVIVAAWTTGAPLGRTTYELIPVGDPVVTLPALERRVVNYRLYIRQSRPDGFRLSADLWVAKAETSRFRTFNMVENFLHIVRQDGSYQIRGRNF